MLDRGKANVLPGVFASGSMTEAVMKTSNRLMTVLFLLGLFAFSAIAYLSPVGQVMAEGAARAVEAASFQADAAAANARQCEDREVEADEGYGISRKEVRHVCQ
jgi:hypothetical protein